MYNAFSIGSASEERAIVLTWTVQHTQKRKIGFPYLPFLLKIVLQIQGDYDSWIKDCWISSYLYYCILLETMNI